MSRFSFSRNGGWPALAAVLLLVAASASAQVSTGTIEVVTNDQDGAGFPGVTVQVVNPDTGMQRVVVADGSGVANFRAMPPGTYDVSANIDGYAPALKEGVVVRLGQTQKLVFSMQFQVSETITVTAEVPVVDVLKTDSSTNVTPEMILDLPVPSREFERLAYIAPGVQRERGGFRFIQNAPVIGSSGNASNNSFMVDGVDLTDQALGLSRTRFSQDAIREFRVVTARFDPEMGGSPGGALNVVTKSGTNDLHGSVFGFYRDADLRETGALEQSNDEFNRYQVGFTIGGAIKKDKVHYFVSYEYINEDTVTLFRPGGAFVDQATDYPQGFNQSLVMGGLDFQLGTSASAFLKGYYEDFSLENFRVGGVQDISNGQQLNRENWNFTVGHTAVFSDGNRLNELRAQYGNRYYFEPTNSDDVEEWFSNGTTLRIGANIVGDILGDGNFFEVRDTFTWHVGGARNSQDIKVGGGWYHIKDRSDIPVYQEGLLVYATDDRSIPLVYGYGEGSADITMETDILSFWFNDDWRPTPTLTLSLGLRYDVDTKGANPDFDDSELVGPRSVDENNFQPRVAFSWDLGGRGKSVLRGGAGIFTGRYLLVPSFSELQQNGTTGRILRSNLSGLALGLPPEFWLDPNDPQNTGIPLPIDATLLVDNLKAPQSTQASLGFTQALGNTGLYVDLEGLYVEGKNEIMVRDHNWNGNDDPGRPNSDYNQINKYGNDGHSKYYAGILSFNGTFGAGHLVTSSVTWAEKKNLSDDFSPVFPFGYPNDPADPEGEWGLSRGHEDLRFVLSGVFRLPANFSLGATYIYGSGQPWNRAIGVDVNGDGKNSDRLDGVGRNSEDGPSFSQFNLRVTWTLPIGNGGLDIIGEAFNLFNTTNYDVNSIDNFEYTSYPTLANPALPAIENENFGEYRGTLQPLEIQLGMRYRF